MMTRTARLSRAAMRGSPTFLKVPRGVLGLLRGLTPVRQRERACSQHLDTATAQAHSLPGPCLPSPPRLSSRNALGTVLVSIGGCSCRLGSASTAHGQVTHLLPSLGLI